jgi:transcription initiation factor TFIIA large subunit
MPASMSMGGPRIKTEPGHNGQPGMPQLTNQMPPQMPPHGMNAQSARDRAASALQQKYGAAAANSVSQMQAQAQAGQGYPQMHPNAHGQMPHIKQEHGYPPMGGQTDGGDDPMMDWKAEVARRRAAAESGEGDRILREHIKQRMSQYEAGGLMRPLTEHESSAKIARRAAISSSLSQNTAEGSSSVPRMAGQVDGADGELKEEDEDAINSDLDDPDDLVADDHDQDESEGQVMLCTYDKVQRVKNKWKCTLKDGILTSGGKEYDDPCLSKYRLYTNFTRYVFHKGQGEFEW